MRSSLSGKQNGYLWASLYKFLAWIYVAEQDGHTPQSVIILRNAYVCYMKFDLVRIFHKV